MWVLEGRWDRGAYGLLPTNDNTQTESFVYVISCLSFSMTCNSSTLDEEEKSSQRSGKLEVASAPPLLVNFG